MRRNRSCPLPRGLRLDLALAQGVVGIGPDRAGIALVEGLRVPAEQLAAVPDLLLGVLASPAVVDEMGADGADLAGELLEAVLEGGEPDQAA